MRRLFPDNTFVAPKMPSGKDLNRLVIAEAPGEQESIEGEPLVGGAGKVAFRLYSSVGVNMNGLTKANCIQCRPPNNVFPTDPAARSYISKDDANKAIEHCYNSHVKPLLNSREWKRVDLLGDKPLRIVGKHSGGIFNRRGSPLDIPRGEKPPLRGLATLHPAYLMRDQVYLPVAANDLAKSLDIPEEHYLPFPSLEDVQAFTATTFALDIECTTYRTMGDKAPVDLVGLSSRANHAICVPVRGHYIPELKRILRDAKVVIGHNILQFDLPKLREAGFKVSEDAQVYDTMLLQHLVFPDFPHDLEFVGSQFVSKPAWKADKSLGWEPYCSRDTDVTLQVFHHLLPMVKKEGLLDLYNEVQVPLARICYLMHKTGFKVDPNQIQFVRAKLLKQSAELESELPDFLRSHDRSITKRHPAPPGTLGKSGKPVKFITKPDTERVVPWRSPTAKQHFLYGNDPGCKRLEPVRDIKTGNITTGKMAIVKLYGKTKDPAILALGKLNKIDELLTTFASKDLAKVSGVYPHFNVHGTASGRLSSSDPNCQNIPEAARIIYVPSNPDWSIVSVDFSNIENRLTALLAGDTERLKRYEDPKHSDYKVLVNRAYGIPYDLIEKDNSREAPYGKAKAIVLGRNYGLGARKISLMYDIPMSEVNKLMATWDNETKLTTLWQQRTANEATKTGVLTTPFKRKRWFWTSSAYTESLSFLPQSTAADLIFRAMIGLMYERIGWPEERVARVVKIYKPLPKPARLLLQVHDELVLECPNNMLDEVVLILKTVMQQSWPELGGAIIPVQVSVGPSWGECEPYGKS